MPIGAEKPSENSAVLDSSALLALILGEPGGERVKDLVKRGAIVSSVNLAEVVSRLMDLDYTAQQVEDALVDFAVPVLTFGAEAGRVAGYLRSSTRHLGLSLGDRACLALAAELKVPAITADRIWLDLDIGVEVLLCR